MVTPGGGLEGLADGLHVGLCGAGSPLPDPWRDGPCTVVVAGQRIFVFDAGSGAARNIVRMGFSAGQVEALFLTHFHSDHIDGVGELLLQRWAQSAATRPLPVHGPTGLTDVLQGFERAYQLDRGYRIAHHGETVVPASGFGAQARMFPTPESGRAVILSDGHLEISTFKVCHDPVDAAVGYRIRYKDRVAVISGDTASCPSVEEAARGADMLVHEALSPALLATFRERFVQIDRKPLAQVMEDVLTYHTTPEQAAAIAKSAGVRALVLSHLIPMVPPGLETAFLGNAPSIYSGPIHVGTDGDFFTLPAGTAWVETGRRW
ncbi:MBL fold metallo-hydrolase [Ramlibacter henchirensis]|uniref:MBL fold metallo-hydrolase n=2 Tax=Ramlibacter henchirensis TaxID=204072 RepID=A0A4Z0CBI3_9BURK|nr:MBL fold metallo-hydrolase [Ramlibacter henchirensis]